MASPLAKKFKTGDRVYVRAQQVWVILVSLVMSKEARPAQLPTYGEIAQKMGLDPRAGIGLGRELGIVGDWCVANDLPALNCIVVGQETGTPGPGVITRKGRSYKEEQRASFKEDWFAYRVPTTGTFRQIWEESR